MAQTTRNTTNVTATSHSMFAKIFIRHTAVIASVIASVILSFGPLACNYLLQAMYYPSTSEELIALETYIRYLHTATAVLALLVYALIITIPHFAKWDENRI